ncbi:MAG TPA: UDP-glucose 4-epimerase GalE [Gammaproteobacteria bacterium]|jgi:UDP-glucose 4-epimerase|nr:UDP-glucose 4-epimerase GalE [Gammaproteobacteria bacterium]
MNTNTNLNADYKNILVVGGAGYIGSHMVLALQQAGFTPIVLDNLSRGHRQAVLNAEFIVGDLADKALLTQIFTGYPIAAVMHFASFIEVAESVRLPAHYYQNNVAATLNLLEVMLQHHIPHFIFSSSAAVYGEPKYTPIDETHPLNPVNPYGRSKAMVEAIIQDYSASYDLRYAILRYFNAAGADPLGRVGECHQPESHLIPLILQAVAHEEAAITVYGRDYPTADGTCVRDYVHVADVCTAHLLALQALLIGEKQIICNIGTGNGHSVQQVFDLIQRITHRTITVHEGTRRAGDPAILVADTALVQQLLGWQAQYSLSEMIEHAWQWTNNLKNIEINKYEFLSNP